MMTRLELNINLAEPYERVPVAVDVIDADFSPVWEGTVFVGRSKSTDSLEAGQYVVRAYMPFGKMLTKQLKITPQSPDPVRVDLYPPQSMVKPMTRTSGMLSGEKEVAYAIDTSYSVVPKGYEEGPTALLDDLAEHVWMRLWVQPAPDESWRVVPWFGRKSRPFDNLIQYTFSKRGQGYKYYLQVGGETVRWQLVALPPDRSIVKIAALPQPVETDTPLRITISHYEQTVESLLGYMDRGAMDKAERVSQVLAEDLLRGKYFEPIKATLGDYYLLRTNQLARRANWAENLARDITWLPDGAVIYAWHLLKQKNPDLAEVRRWLLAAVKRGMPIYTEGLRLLYDALVMFSQADEINQPEIEAALARVKPYAAAADWHAPTVTFPGSDPDRPGSGRNRQASPLKGLPPDLSEVVWLSGRDLDKFMLGFQIDPIKTDEILADARAAAIKWEGTLGSAGPSRRGKAEKAFTALRQGRLKIDNPEAHLQRLRSKDFEARGLELSPAIKQSMQGKAGYGYYLVTAPVLLHPGRGAQYRLLESSFTFAVKSGQRAPAIQNIFPKPIWKSVLAWGGALTLALDSNLEWGAEVDQVEAKIAKVGGELAGRVNNQNRLAGFIKLNPFAHSLGRMEVEATFSAATAVWRIDSQRLFRSGDNMQFVMLLKVPKAAKQIKVEAAVQAEVSFNWLVAQVDHIRERLPETIKQIISREEGLPLQDFQSWTLDLPE